MRVEARCSLDFKSVLGLLLVLFFYAFRVLDEDMHTLLPVSSSGPGGRVGRLGCTSYLDYAYTFVF